MNILDILRSRVEKLPQGEYIRGLKAVVQHIEVASKHLERGQFQTDDTAFTDAIYRTNQAFEGSLKEAYRVLANREPAHVSTFNIENYLKQENIFRPRVLAQLTSYRQEWRNPSTHDYRLDFDEDEALLAIVSVSAFAIVLTDQITERVAFERARTIADVQLISVSPTQSLLDQVVPLIKQFLEQFNKTHPNPNDIREAEIVGTLAGFLTSTAPNLRTHSEVRLVPDQHLRPDLLLTSTNEQIIVEVKRTIRPSKRFKDKALQQVAKYMSVGNIDQAILLVYSGTEDGVIVAEEQNVQQQNGRVVIISTASNANNKS